VFALAWEARGLLDEGQSGIWGDPRCMRAPETGRGGLELVMTIEAARGGCGTGEANAKRRTVQATCSQCLTRRPRRR